MPDKPDERGQQLYKRYEQLVDKRRTWEPMWRELAEFIRPNTRRVNENRSKGSKQTERLYDTTAPDACRKLASFLNGALTSASTRWFSLIPRDPELMKIRAVAMWLDDTATKMYGGLQQSNFKARVTQVYSSLGSLCTAALFVEERDLNFSGFNGFRFTVIPVGEFVADEDADGKVTTFCRVFSLSAMAAVGKFGMEKMSEKIQQAFKEKPHDRFEFLHCIYPRKVMPGYLSTRLPYASVYLDCQTKAIVQEGGYHEMPVMVVRWEVEEGEVYGKGPGYVALPDIRSLNKLKELGLQAATLAVRPPLQVPHDGVVGGQIRLTPAAQNTVMGDGEIKPIALGGDVHQEVIRVEDLRNAIKSVFYRDLVALPDKNYMTATEIIKQLDLIHRELGPTIGQIESDLLNPLIDRCFALMFRAGSFLPPPAELAGAELDIEYEGPLARAQRSGDFTALQEGLAIAAGISQYDEEAMDLIDTDQVVEYAWDVTGNPARLLRDKRHVKQIRESRAQAAQQQAANANAQEQADVANTSAQAMATMKQTMQPAQVGNA